MSDSEPLLSGIARDAEAEAWRVVEEARQASSERKAAAESQIAGILEEARRKAGEQGESLRRQIASSAKMEAKRIGLKERERAIHLVLEQARERLELLLDSPEYREVLIGWIVEAAIGLGLPEAKVNASVRELRLIDETFLAEAETRIFELTGRKVHLIKADGQPLLAQGVVLVGRDGRLQFNNQVTTRLLRLQTKIRKIIYDTLWKSES
jgi:vacuolar-type H+-ATPase subunit E/Vma4